MYFTGGLQSFEILNRYVEIDFITLIRSIELTPRTLICFFMHHKFYLIQLPAVTH